MNENGLYANIQKEKTKKIVTRGKDKLKGNDVSTLHKTL